MTTIKKLFVVFLLLMLCTAIVSAKVNNKEKTKIKIEKIRKKFLKLYKEHLNKLKKAVVTSKSNAVYVWISEDYSFELGSSIKWVPELYIDIDIYDLKLNNITLKLKLPSGVEPKYSWGDVPTVFNFDNSNDILTIKYNMLDRQYIWTGIELLGLKDYIPFVVEPKTEVYPSYCAPYESKYVNVSLSGFTLNGSYDYLGMELEVDNVKTVNIVNTTPSANYTYTYNDTIPLNGDYWSYGYAEWYYYSVESVPRHTMVAYVQNDIDQVNLWYWCWFEKYSPLNVKIIDISTDPQVLVYNYSYTWIDTYSKLSLDPANYSIPHGVLAGFVVNDNGQPLSGADIYISGSYNNYYFYVDKVTDENGTFTVLLPPADYWIWIEYGFSPYDNEYEGGFWVNISQNLTTNYSFVLQKVPTVVMNVKPIDDSIVDGVLSYNITITNTGKTTELIDLYGDYNFWNDSLMLSGLEWYFSDNDFYLLPGQSKSIIAYAKYKGDTIVPYGVYATSLWCYPENNNGTGYYYVNPFLKANYIGVNVKADKDVYTPGDTIALNVSLSSNGGPYPVLAQLIVKYGDWSGILAQKYVYYPKNYNTTKTIYISIPKLIPAGYYEFEVLLNYNDTVIGKGGDVVEISGAVSLKTPPKFNVKNQFEII